jgi:hypothetical protein
MAGSYQRSHQWRAGTYASPACDADNPLGQVVPTCRSCGRAHIAGTAGVRQWTALEEWLFATVDGNA